MNPDQRALLALAAQPRLAPMAMAGSPLAEALQARLLQASTTGEVTVSFEPGPVFTQAAGVVQGGAVSAMLDFVLAYAALLAVPEGQSVATASLNVVFLRPASAGPLLAAGRVERAGRSLVYTVAELCDGEQRRVATATAVLPVVPWK